MDWLQANVIILQNIHEVDKIARVIIAYGHLSGYLRVTKSFRKLIMSLKIN